MILELDGVSIPYTKEGEVSYYPIKFIFKNFLLKGNVQLHKKSDLVEYIKRFTIDFSIKGTTAQECYCMNQEGWRRYLNNCQSNKNKTDDKARRYKILCDHFNVEVVDSSKKYDEYTVSCISNHKKPKTKECARCGRNLLNNEYFFNKDSRASDGIVNVCRQCNGGEWLNDNGFEKFIYDSYGIEAFEKYKTNFVDFYKKHVLTSDIQFRVDGTKDPKLAMLRLIKCMFDNGVIGNNDLNKDILTSKLNLNFKKCSALTNPKIIEYCIEDIRLRPWKCKEYIVQKLTKQEANNILRTYINENNIIIKDKFKYDGWGKLAKESKIRGVSDKDLLGFIVDFYDRRYGGYKFNIASSNYYKCKDNLILDMKYLIEKDLKIPVDKIPLYITKYSISQKANKLYSQLRKTNRVFDNLYDWIDACYPNKFIRSDFDLNPYRSQFDSLEEAQVDEQLKIRFKSVIYNPRDSVDKVEIQGCIPDWIIPTIKGCYLVEYYGLWQEKESKTSHRLQRYKQTHAKKINIYSELEKVGYKHLGIYPNDLLNNFEGLHIKINNILN